MSQLVAVLSGPERTRAKAGLALEDAHLTLLPADHHSVARESFDAEHWDAYLTPLPSGEKPTKDHGFLAVAVDGKDELNRAVRVVEQHKWVLRTHREMPSKPAPDPMSLLLAEYDRRIADLEKRLTNPPMRGGAVETPAWATQAGSFGAEQTRRAVFSGYARSSANSPGILSGGLLSATDCQLAAPVSGLSVNISTGELIIPGTEGGSQGGYYGEVTSTTNLTISTANPSNPRIDMVCATVFDAAYTTPSHVSGISSGAWGLQVVTGTATSGATLTNLSGAATLPGSSLLLGYVLVPAAATNIVSGDIANKATTVVRLGTAFGFANLTSGVSCSGSTITALTGWTAAASNVGVTTGSGGITVLSAGVYAISAALAYNSSVVNIVGNITANTSSEQSTLFEFTSSTSGTFTMPIFWQALLAANTAVSLNVNNQVATAGTAEPSTTISAVRVA